MSEEDSVFGGLATGDVAKIAAAQGADFAGVGITRLFPDVEVGDVVKVVEDSSGSTQMVVAGRARYVHLLGSDAITAASTLDVVLRQGEGSHSYVLEVLGINSAGEQGSLG